MENIQKRYIVPRCGAAPSLVLDEGHRLRRTAHSFFRAVRVVLSGSINSSAFQEVSLGREVSIIFTSNGPLIYRWEGIAATTGARGPLSIATGNIGGDNCQTRK
jgi:hypothetical protein